MGYTSDTGLYAMFCALVYLSGCANPTAQIVYSDIGILLEEVKERSILFNGLDDPSVVYFMDGKQDSLTITPIPDQHYSSYFNVEIASYKCYEHSGGYIVASQFISRTFLPEHQAIICRKTEKRILNIDDTGIPPAPSGFEPQSFLFVQNGIGKFELVKSGLFNPRFPAQ